jgi:hypothetical protein
LRAGKVNPALTTAGALRTAMVQFARHGRRFGFAIHRPALVKFHDGAIISDGAILLSNILF